MMRVEDLSVWVTDASGKAVGVIDADFLPGAVFAPRISDVGTWSLTLPDMVDGAPYPLAKELAKPGSGIVVFVPTSTAIPTLISGPTESRDLRRDDQTPQGLWTFTGVSDETILDGPLAYPDPSSADPAAQSATQWKRTGKVESLLRQVTAFNIANGLLRIPVADWAPAGRLTGARKRFVVSSEDQARGTTKTITCRYENILDVCKGLVADQALVFRAVRGHWSPVITAGASTIHLVISESQLLDATHLIDLVSETAQAEQATQGNRSVHRVIAAGDEEGPGTVAVADAAVSAGEYPRESFISATGATDEVQEAALTELAAGASTTTFTVTPRDDLADDPLAWLGNTVPVAMSADRSIIDHARVNQVIVSVDAERVHTQIVLGNPDGSDWESQALARIDSLAGRVAALEKNNNMPYARTQIDNAQQTADDAQQAADDAQAAASDAALAAGSVQLAVNGLNHIFYQPDPPSDSDVPGDDTIRAKDTWYDTSDGNHMYRYDGETWVDVALGAGALDQAIIFQIDAAMSTAQGAQDGLDTFSTWFRIDEAGAHMGRTDSPFQTHVLPERFAITENGQTTTYWESGRMVVPSAVVDELVFANHKIEQYGSGSVVRSI